jgi:hypothetical protein
MGSTCIARREGTQVANSAMAKKNNDAPTKERGSSGLLGGDFQPQAGQPEHVAIIGESAAKRLWPGQNPIGRTLRLGTENQFHNEGELLPDGPVWQIIGMARDTRGVTLDGSDSRVVKHRLQISC